MSIVITSGGDVYFPGLGLTIEHLVEGFDIFGFHISISGILIAVAMFLGLFITEYLAKKTEQNTEQYLDLAIRVVLASIAGARIGYVITHWQYFMTDQGNVFNISDGGMSATGAVIAGLIASFLYCRKKKLSWLQICDTAMPGIVIGQILSSLGCFFGRNMLGTYSNGPFAMRLSLGDVDSKAVARVSPKMMMGNFIQVHPVALYETAILTAVLVLLLVLWKFKKVNGMILSVYLIGYGIMIFCMEFVRLDSQKIMGSRFSIEHIIAFSLILMGTAIMGDQLKKHRMARKAQPKNFISGKKNK